VLGNRDSTGCETYTAPSRFPDLGHTYRSIHGCSICRRPGCSLFRESSEAVTVHLECFELFRETCRSDDALDRLWIVAAWRLPWRSALPVVLPDESDVPQSALVEVSERHGVALLGRMPVEIVRLIRKYCATSLLWRLACALELASRLDAMATNEFISMPFFEIGLWERGGPAVSSNRQLRFVRLVIDSRGIKMVERLQDKPEYSRRRFDSLVFIVEDEAYFTDVTAWLKVFRSYFGFSG
jgi:hypothetical protein